MSSSVAPGPISMAIGSPVEEHYPQFLERIDAEGVLLPHFVIEEFEASLKCRRLEYGFLRVKYDACRHEKLVAFSCEHHGFCPSCGARRMAETAAHLVEHVLPKQPIRQWVLSFPYPIQFLFATRLAVLTQVLGIVYRAVSTFLVRRAGLRSGAVARTGAVTLIQRLGSALNLNPYLHMLFVDGAYTFDDETPRFHRVAAPTQGELQRLLHAIATRVTRALEKQGLLTRNEENPSLDIELADDFEQLLAAAVHYRIATGPHAGRKALTLRTVGPSPPPDNPCIALLSGFSLHAGTVCEAHERDSLEGGDTVSARDGVQAQARHRDQHVHARLRLAERPHPALGGCHRARHRDQRRRGRVEPERVRLGPAHRGLTNIGRGSVLAAGACAPAPEARRCAVRLRGIGTRSTTRSTNNGRRGSGEPRS